MAKKKKSIYSRRLKDVNKDGKRNFGDTWLGDLIGADGKIGIGEGRPGLKDSLKGDRREKPITKKPKKKPPVGKKPKRKPKSEAKPNVRVGVKTSTSVVGVKSDRHSGAGGSKSKNITDRKFDPPDVQSKRKTDKSKTVDRSKIPYADRVVEKKLNKTVPKDPKTDTSNQSVRDQPTGRKKFISPAIQSMYDYFYPEQDSGAVESVVKRGDRKRNRNKTGPSGLSRGGVIDYRTKGMFYGGSVKKGRK
jgi:hypothetical protein